jgi:hypothetical protein
MNAASENLITLTVVGIESEHGHVRADELLDEISDLLLTLNRLDRIVGQTASPTLYYRIVAVHHASPLSITLEPVVRRKIQKPTKDHIQIRHARFFRELDAIRRNEPVSPDIDDQLLEHLRDLTVGVERSFKAVTISNHQSRVDLDKTFETNVRKLLDEEDASYGHVEGSLDTVNIHGYARRFWIYPRIGAQKIRCDFLPGEADRIREALGRYIRVEGVKFFRPQSPYAYRVAVKEFEILSEGEQIHLKDLRGMAVGATGELSSVDFVRAIRNEWD